MAESSERELTPDEAFSGSARKAFCSNPAADAAALTAGASCRCAASHPPIMPLEDP